MVEIRLLEMNKEQGKLSFLLKDADPSIANILRDAMINKVPVLAIEDVEFRKNSSVLYNEIIAHRLGLVPIKTDLKSYNLPEECTCKGKGCAKCTLKMALAANNAGYVHTSKMKSKDPKAVPVYNMPIVKLLKGQGLQLEAVAVMGTGKQHAKWSPCLAYYKYKPVIDIAKEPKNPERVVECCPVGIFKLKDGKLAIDKDNLLKCHLCESCVDVSDGAVKVEGSETDFVCYVESWGQLECKEIVTEALDILEKEFDDFIKQLSKKK